MTRRDVEKVSAGVDRISEEIRAQLGAESPKLVLQIECCGRGKMMLRDQKKTQILDKLQHKIGSDVPWLGFYSLAEIGPIAGHNCLHNYTSVVVALYGDNAETATLEQQQPLRQPITQAEYNTQPKPAQAEIIELGQANQPLVEEVKRLSQPSMIYTRCRINSMRSTGSIISCTKPANSSTRPLSWQTCYRLPLTLCSMG